jgi:D-alanine-D-alanine ligase
MKTISDISQLGKVAVLYGGTSFEREISLRGGKTVFERLRSKGVDVCLMEPSKQLIDDLRTAKIDRVFIALHGGEGEDGTIQGALTTAQIPYTGSDMTTCVVAMNKCLSQLLWQHQGLLTPNFCCVRTDSDLADALKFLKWPLIVKPESAGSSLGVSLVKHKSDLTAAVSLARQYSDRLLLQEYIEGDEYMVTVVDGTCLPALKVQTDHVLFDYEAKYESSNTYYDVVESFDEAHVKMIQAAFDGLNCRGCVRFDVIIDGGGDLFLLEANTIPGLHQESAVAFAVKCAGLDYGDFLVSLLVSTMRASA